MVTDILLVDDSEETRETTAALLEWAGYGVVCAADGREALEQLRAGLEPHLILLDLQMPRMSGTEFRAEQLADPRLSRIPVVVYSASDSVRLAASRMGVAHCLRKPADSNSLLALADLYCARAEGARHGPGGRRHGRRQ